MIAFGGDGLYGIGGLGFEGILRFLTETWLSHEQTKQE
jgi:hypothetical protein